VQNTTIRKDNKENGVNGNYKNNNPTEMNLNYKRYVDDFYYELTNYIENIKIIVYFDINISNLNNGKIEDSIIYNINNKADLKDQTKNENVVYLSDIDFKNIINKYSNSDEFKNLANFFAVVYNIILEGAKQAIDIESNEYQKYIKELKNKNYKNEEHILELTKFIFKDYYPNLKDFLSKERNQDEIISFFVKLSGFIENSTKILFNRINEELKININFEENFKNNLGLIEEIERINPNIFDYSKTKNIKEPIHFENKDDFVKVLDNYINNLSHYIASKLDKEGISEAEKNKLDYAFYRVIAHKYIDSIEYSREWITKIILLTKNTYPDLDHNLINRSIDEMKTTGFRSYLALLL